MDAHFKNIYGQIHVLCTQSLSHVRLFVKPWIAACQTPPGFSRQEYWSGLPCPSPGFFPTQESSPGLLHCRQILYHLSPQGSPQILEWVAYPFSRESSLTQELNRDLPHYRQMLYQLSYQGSSSTDTYICIYMHTYVVSSVVWFF